MTLHEAINAAFCQSEFVRRASWPEGSAAIVDPMSTNPFGPYRRTMGRTELVSPTPNTADLCANDWDPSDDSGQLPGQDWKDVLRIGIGREMRSIAGRDPCGVQVAGHYLEGSWRLVWMKPENFWLWIVSEQEVEWPRPTELLLPPRMTINANGVDVLLRLHSVDELYADRGQLFKILVTRDA